MENRWKERLKDPLLLVIDMQNVYSKNQKWACGNYEGAREKILQLMKGPFSDKKNVIYTKYTASEAPAGVWKDYNAENADVNADKWLNELDPELEKVRGNIRCFDKSVYSAYDIEEVRLAASRASAVVVTGVVAECCVLSTVMALIDAGSYIFYISDAVAGVDEETEKAVVKVLEGLAPLHLTILTTAELEQLMKGMHRRKLGKTGLMVSEIGFGGEWLERHSEEEGIELIHYAFERGINLIDCWMPDPKSRDIIGKGICANREDWIIQGHIGATWKNNQYYRTREMEYVRPAFEDLLRRLQTDYIDLGMIHYVDSEEEWEQIQTSDYLDYVMELKEKGIIRHIGMSSHNPRVAAKAAKSGYVEMILFSINPAFDMLPASEDINSMFAESFDEELKGIDPERALLYKICEENEVGLTVMKGFAGGRLLDEKRSPFGVSLTPVQCIHYALTRPAVASVLCGYDTKEQVAAAVAYETSTTEERDYASVIASAPLHSYKGQCTYCGHCRPCPKNIDIAMVNKFYDLAVMQETVPDSIRSHYGLLSHHAGECIGCKSCESRCPFGVNISERMKKTAQLFGL